MTHASFASACPFMEAALSIAATESRARNCEMQVLLGTDGHYRVADGDSAPDSDETLVAMVGAEGETLIYALRMVA